MSKGLLLLIFLSAYNGIRLKKHVPGLLNVTSVSGYAQRRAVAVFDAWKIL